MFVLFCWCVRTCAPSRSSQQVFAWHPVSHSWFLCSFLVVGVDPIFASFLHLAAVSFSVVVYRWTRQNHTPKIIQTNKPTKLQQIMHPVLYRCVSYGVLPHDEAKRLFKVVLDRKRHGRSAASSPSPVRKKPPKAKILKDEGLYDADFVVSGGDGIGTATL